MATVYKTPGVFVEEISKLPPSVAQVETAIPAFIGYTEKAMDLAPDDLLKKPKKIGSRAEFELYFGVGPSPTVTEVNINDSNVFVSAKVTNKFFLYDSIVMFYANGGGDCYIVSVGNYLATVIDTDFTTGITAIEKEDEPTILAFPDAVTLADDKIANVQQAALLQCSSLQDRVGLFDTKQADAKGAAFRANIGINFLNYGAVYTPWLKVSLPKAIKYPDVKSVIKRSGIAVTLQGITADAAIQAKITDLDRVYADVANITAKTILLSPTNGNLWDKFNTLEAAFNTTNNTANLKAAFQYVYDIALQIDEYVKAADPDELTLAALKTDVTNAISSNFAPIYQKIIALDKDFAGKITTPYTPVAIATVFTAAAWPPAITGTAASNIVVNTNDNDRRTSTFSNLKLFFDELNRSYLNLISGAATSYTKTLDQALALSFPAYKSILAGVGNSMTSMPPSGAVAGIYSLVDRTRGVWKAPANVSLSNVISPEVTFTKTELDALNVDTVAGKSVNAIRTFTGKGTLIYGARTLAGNDNEWRYISVRRFFNMVEESCKKATEAFVFEPNDGNTWVKVQGMIENFLITLWRQGALQGAKPEHAFFVAVGLGKTMTAVDILEGKMIVEIGMAVVRPAEFIILRFSHKMAES
jgi:uncharacterized protein